ncbi:MBL fold hydrolase [Acidihalobacter aeolianus]|uniref:MBL fold hydrolase n=1 Tax=Acidihalobacter aeolianus TaxID=2792603 RepID=A0A1D8K6R5_9GAMM|nr:MBL fold metallo-hydrolase [Acidihalobacter aeolianus]AOV16662.1 MBL fold hydrolase [Acidihalobacter aeolianus]
MTQDAGYRIHTLSLGPMDNFVYLIQDLASQRAAVVDPAWDVPAIRRLADETGVRITDILLTHSHHDHINGVDELLQATDAEVHLLKPEASFWGHPLAKPSLHHGGDRFQLGDTEIELLHTPGHTPGSTCYRLGDDLITGDTLFVFGCGRCDLKGGDPEAMFDTLRHLREDLPADTRIRPGHNYAEKTTSTIEEQARCNPFMHFADVDRFVHYRQHEHDRIRSTPYPPECKD